MTPRLSSSIKLVTKSIETAILATCRTINLEASKILRPRLDKLRLEPTRFIVDQRALYALTYEYGLLPHLRAMIYGYDTTYPSPPRGEITFLGQRLVHSDIKYNILILFLNKAARHIRTLTIANGVAKYSRPILVSFTVSPYQHYNHHAGLTSQQMQELESLVLGLASELNLPFGATLTPPPEQDIEEDMARGFIEAHVIAQKYGYRIAGTYGEVGLYGYHGRCWPQPLAKREQWVKDWEEGNVA